MGTVREATAGRWTIRRWILIGLALIGVAAGAAVVQIVQSGSNARAHVDPALVGTPESAKPKSPNWALVHPWTTATMEPGRFVAPAWKTSPSELIERFEEVALAEPRVEKSDSGAADPLWRSYVQRSRIFGFPDYISVRAVEVQTPEGPGASLYIYSRSVYGYSDLGVNSARVRRWLETLKSALPPSY